MKVIFTGGGTGGHFYPIIAVAEELTVLAQELKLLEMKLYLFSDSPYGEKFLFDNKITFVKSTGGKMRRYFSILNFFGLFKTAWGVITTFRKVFKIYPDVVFGKGGYVSFPTLVAARLLGIPVIIHESDSEPGRVNLWAGKFAKKIAISYPSAAEFFPKDKVAYTGNPVRRGIRHPLTSGAHEFLGLEEDVPVIFILGGSQGAKIINDTLLQTLPELVQKYQIIHQTGRKNYKEVVETSGVVLGDNQFKGRYKPFDYLNDLAMSMAAGVADLIVSRAGSVLFEIAAWGIPSIIVPISPEVSHDQHKNAFHYARTGACTVIDENNLSPHILIAEITRLIEAPDELKKMSEAAKSFGHPDAARKIAEEIMRLGLPHEK
ncbi:MAG: undecaprenyldiphospho-muramoylpentapeptide beta-N-acetylglucosaminyltransferase [Candidatus Taylorbacteria bacterium]